MGPNPSAARLLLQGRTLLARPTTGPSPKIIPVVTAPLVHSRNANFWTKWFARQSQKPVTEKQAIADLIKENPRDEIERQKHQLPKSGSMSSSSIFGDEDHATELAEAAQATQKSNYAMSLAVRDPTRDSWMWPRRHQWKLHKRRGRLTKEQLILQTEKSHTLKSHFLKTSVKKLAPLARQIAGKKLEWAMVQMEFSPKGPAKEILEHLKEARNEAIVRKGMDPKEMYIEQAWVGRGTYGIQPKKRARGRIDFQRPPQACITVVLKEEKTRQRIAQEKAAKEARKPYWQPLPSRPLYGQRQYYQW